jgi:hypothetical protein
VLSDCIIVKVNPYSGTWNSLRNFKLIRLMQKSITEFRFKLKEWEVNTKDLLKLIQMKQ